MEDPLKQLPTLTLSDSFNIYLTLPGKNLTSFHRELCELKADPDYVNIKTVTRWRKGESRPREGLFTPDDFKHIFMNSLSDSFSGRENMMLDHIADFLKNTLKYDISIVESAANINTRAAFSALIDIISSTTLSEEKSPIRLYLRQLESIDAKNSTAPAAENAAENSTKDLDKHSEAPTQQLGSAIVKFTAPPTPFDVTYWLRHVKNGKDEFLSGSDKMPINRNIKFEPTDDGSRRLQAVVENVPSNIGFQFKCFARCARENAAQLGQLLADHIDYSNAVFKTADGHSFYSKQYDEELELISTSRAEPETVWFILPDYSVYVTFDPFINNYFMPEFND